MFGLQSWDMDIGGNFKDIAKVMSTNNRVLFVNRPLDMISRFSRRNIKQIKERIDVIKKRKPSLNKMQDNLWVLNPAVTLYSINNLPKGRIYNYLNRLNNRKVAKEIENAIAELNFRKDILIIDCDFFNGLYLKEMINPKIFIYYLRDYLRFHKYFEKHGAAAEPAIMSKADAVITDSDYLNDYALTYNLNAVYVPKGCGEEYRRLNYAIPEDLKKIEGPKIGYLGNLLSRRLSIPILENVASKLKNFNFIFIGPEDNTFKTSKLHQLPNVYFLGFKEQKHAPAYIQHLDVCLNIQIANETTIGNHPRKIIEYLSAGKPIVATSTDAMREFETVVHLCETEVEFEQAILKAYNEISDLDLLRLRRSAGNKYTWEATVEKFYNIIEMCDEKKNR